VVELKKHKEGAFVLPCVVDVMDFESHIVLDIIHLKGDGFKKDSVLSFGGIECIISKKLKDAPIQTEMNIENRLEIRKVRYFCNKINRQTQ
jgi:hypothetical protein